MSDYTITNLREIDDSADNAELEARFARKHLSSEHLGVSFFRYGPGYRSGRGHSHREQEEVYVSSTARVGSSSMMRSSSFVSGTRFELRRTPCAHSRAVPMASR
jgi:hypothetical protein